MTSSGRPLRRAWCTTKPTISGTPITGSRLIGTLGTWSGKSVSFARQWTKDGADIVGETADSYVIASGDIGHQIGFRVTATNIIGSTSASSAPVTVTAAPSDAPPGVIAAGLTTEWGYKQTAGIKIVTNKTLPADEASLPAGASLGTFGPASSLYVRFTIGCDISRWDFSGYDLIVDGCTVNATNCRVKFVGGGRAAETMNGGVMNLIDIDIDLTGLLSFFHGGLTNPAGCTMTWTDVHAWGAPRIYLDNFGAFTKTRSYVEAFGIDTDPLDHGECIKTDKGSYTDENSVTDIGEGGPILSGITAIDFLKADLDGDITASKINSIYNYSDTQPLLYTFQAGINPGRAMTINVGGCAIKRGTSGYIAADAGIVINDLGGNYDLVSGNSIVIS